MSPRLALGHVAKDFDGRLANVRRSYEEDTSPEAGTIRWLVANLLRARHALHEIAKNTELPAAAREMAERALEEVPDAS